MSLRIELFTPGLQPQVEALVLSIQQKEFGLPISAAEQPDLVDIPNFIQRGDGNFWVAMAGDEVVGTIALLDIGGGSGALRKMFVAPGWRGRDMGAAAALLAALLAWARAHGLREILLGTTASYHAAHRFYEKYGFTELPRAELPPNFPQFRLDSRFYRMRL